MHLSITASTYYFLSPLHLLSYLISVYEAPHQFKLSEEIPNYSLSRCPEVPFGSELALESRDPIQNIESAHFQCIQVEDEERTKNLTLFAAGEITVAEVLRPPFGSVLILFDLSAWS